MKKDEVIVGGEYSVKVSGKVVPVRIVSKHPTLGWHAINTTTNRKVRIKSPRRLRAAVGAAAGKAAAGKASPLLVASGSEFTEALNGASVEDLQAAVRSGLGDAKRRGRLTAALRVRSGVPATDAADAVAAATREVESPLTVGASRAMARSEPGKGKSQTAIRRGGKPKASGKKAGAGRPVKKAAAKPRAAAKSKKLGGLGAVARVLCEAGRPMACHAMVAVALKKGLWSSKGKTPAATVYSAIIREISAKGKGARFRKTAPGTFVITPAGKLAVAAGRRVDSPSPAA